MDRKIVPPGWVLLLGLVCFIGNLACILWLVFTGDGNTFAAPVHFWFLVGSFFTMGYCWAIDHANNLLDGK